eukprot:TRINITY_DN6903_c0_g1_i11.p1 TRINITY_DN6903_c0_g1~~TRINITY_DN6903_c0_g1_i11.p1  ORF type:complete len:374 (+),score=27.83 TRINITY_DN6903_c0_g1_i11:2-1123(+)
MNGSVFSSIYFLPICISIRQAHTHSQSVLQSLFTHTFVIDFETSKMAFNQYGHSLSSAPQLGMTSMDPNYIANYSPQTHFSSPAPAISQSEEIRTVFITGFPSDVQTRELNNLLRFLPGYKASQMNWKNGQAQGFALFDSGLSARQSVESISQLVFDENHVLRCEMARKNMYVKEETVETSASRQSGFGTYPPPHSAPDFVLQSSGQGMGIGLAAPVPAPVRPQGYGQVTNTRDNPPCNTLFVGNLSDTVDENDLKFLFSTQPGFRQMKLVRSDKGTNCFVEFADDRSATVVHHQQQGAILATSDRGPIRIQFSKNPFGQKRETNNAYDSSSLPGVQQSSGPLGTPYMTPSPRIESMGFASPQPSPQHYQHYA